MIEVRGVKKSFGDKTIINGVDVELLPGICNLIIGSSGSGKSVTANFPKPLPVYIIYMSSAATVDGRIIDYPDVYKRDSRAITALLDTTPGGTATRTAAK